MTEDQVSEKQKAAEKKIFLCIGRLSLLSGFSQNCEDAGNGMDSSFFKGLHEVCEQGILWLYDAIDIIRDGEAESN